MFDLQHMRSTMCFPSCQLLPTQKTSKRREAKPQGTAQHPVPLLKQAFSAKQMKKQMQHNNLVKLACPKDAWPMLIYTLMGEYEKQVHVVRSEVQHLFD